MSDGSDGQFGARSPRAAEADVVTLEIIRNAFIATVRQAGRIVVRSSFSPIIRDAFDFCVTIVAPPRPADDLDLDIVAMNESLAHFSGVMPFAVRNMLWEYGIENLEPGDLIAFNNPYKSGNHIYDNGFFRPVFVDGEFVAAIAIKAHLMDMGGAMAGGYASASVRSGKRAWRSPASPSTRATVRISPASASTPTTRGCRRTCWPTSRP
jgi:N-methylhydantoinase B/oxoprolinase/acetone carboxylase alpha subunit